MSVEPGTEGRIGAGLRRLTPGLMIAEKAAARLQGDPLPPRHKARHAVDVLRSVGRLDAEEAETLGVLIEFCGTWERERVAVVFASNARLRSRLNGVKTDRGVRKRLARLGAKGFICHDERPGARRGVEIDPISGDAEYFGISLLPLVALLPEAEQIEEAREESYRERAAQRRKARAMTTRIEALTGIALEIGLDRDEWLGRSALAVEMMALAVPCDDAADLEVYASELARMRDECEEIVNGALNVQSRPEPEYVDNGAGDLSTDSVDGTGDGSRASSGYPEPQVPPYTISKDSTDKSEQCRRTPLRSEAKPRTLYSCSAPYGAENGLETKPGGTDSPVKGEGRDQAERPEQKKGDLTGLASGGASSAAGESAGGGLADAECVGSDMSVPELVKREIDKHRVTPEHLVGISEGLYAYLPFDAVDDPTWADVIRAADQLRPVIGMSEYGWRLVVETIGPIGATAALAFVTSDPVYSGVRSSAPGYLRSFEKIAKQGGTLNIGQKIRAVLARKAEQDGEG